VNIKILKKISERVKYTEDILPDGTKQYKVERKEENGAWDVLSKSTSAERALAKKHNAWILELHKLNYSSRLLNRRKAWDKKVRKDNS
jgi:hypothetical protein